MQVEVTNKRIIVIVDTPEDIVSLTRLAQEMQETPEHEIVLIHEKYTNIIKEFHLIVKKEKEETSKC